MSSDYVVAEGVRVNITSWQIYEGILSSVPYKHRLFHIFFFDWNIKEYICKINGYLP